MKYFLSTEKLPNEEWMHYDTGIEEQCDLIASSCKEEDSLICFVSSLQVDESGHVIYNLGKRFKTKFIQIDGSSSELGVWNSVGFSSILDFSLKVAWCGQAYSLLSGFAFGRPNLSAIGDCRLYTSSVCELFNEFKCLCLVGFVDRVVEYNDIVFTLDFDGIEVPSKNSMVVKMFKLVPEHCKIPNDQITLLMSSHDGVLRGTVWDKENTFPDEATSIKYLKDFESEKKKMMKKVKHSIRRQFSDKIAGRQARNASQDLFSQSEQGTPDSNIESQNKTSLKKLLLLSLKQVGITKSHTEFQATWKTVYSACQFALVFNFNSREKKLAQRI